MGYPKGSVRVVHRRSAESQRAAEESFNRLSEGIIGAAIEVHRSLGPGLLESIYEEALARECDMRGTVYRRQAEIGSHYKGSALDLTFRVDFVVEETLIIEIKAVESIQEVHSAQLLTYLRLTNFRLGLLINFNVPVLWRGVRRIVNNL